MAIALALPLALALLLPGPAAAPATAATAAIVDPAAGGATFDGVGGASGGGGGTRLLVDYPEPVRSDLLDLLFKPRFGLSLQHLKVEIGCDGDTTQGSEPTHARSETDVSFDRGYEIWFMQQAVKRRADMQLSGLEWGIPGWVAAKGGMWGAANQQYMVGWVSGLLKHKGLNITALAVSYNERGYDDTFMKGMRKALDSAGLAHVKTIGGDQCGRSVWKIVSDMQKDKELADAIDIIGVHNPGPIASDAASMPPGTLELGKPIWGTEQHIGENGLGGVVPDKTDPYQRTDLPVWDWHAALGMAKAVNQGYLTANQTSVLIWTPTYSWYEYICLSGKGMIVANTPWSGHYEIPAAVWTVAHTTQFVQPGWKFLTSPGACAFLGDGIGSVVSYVSPDGADLSIVIETAQSNATNTLSLALVGRFATLASLHAWRTNRSASFVQQPEQTLSHGVLRLTLPPGEVLTLTTTTGQRKGDDGLTVPPAANFSLPHSDDFDALPEDTTPKFTSDMAGVFTAATVDGVPGKVLRQQTNSASSCTHGGGGSFGTVIGDGSWIDYQLEVSARTEADGGFVFVGSHAGVFTDGSLGTNGFWPYYIHTSRMPPGFLLQITFPTDGNVTSWFLQAGTQGTAPHLQCDDQKRACPVVVVGNGTLPGLHAGDWAHVKLSAVRAPGAGTTAVKLSVNGAALLNASVATSSEARGAAFLGCGIHHAQFDNFSVGIPASVGE